MNVDASHVRGARGEGAQRVAVALALALGAAPGGVLAADHAHHADDHPHGATVPAVQRAPLAEARAEIFRARSLALPPPKGVTDLDFSDFFEPIGDRGLTYTEKLRSLAGKPVRILGYMVRQDEPAPGTILLAPFPFQLHESEYGLAEDLPATVVHVTVPDKKGEVVPFTPGLLLLTGDLAIGPDEEPDGRVSTVRLHLHPRAVPQRTAARKTEKKR